jgi:hypothetical protein
MLSFVVKGGDAAALRFVRALRLAIEASSLGGVETLVSLPFNTSHVKLSEAGRAAAGIPPGLVRVSVGIEDPRTSSRTSPRPSNGLELVPARLRIADDDPRRGVLARPSVDDRAARKPSSPCASIRYDPGGGSGSAPFPSRRRRVDRAALRRAAADRARRRRAAADVDDVTSSDTGRRQRPRREAQRRRREEERLRREERGVRAAEEQSYSPSRTSRNTNVPAASVVCVRARSSRPTRA